MRSGRSQLLRACAASLPLLLLLVATASAAPSCPPSKASTTYGERYAYLDGDIAAAVKEGKGAPLSQPLFAAAAAYDLPRVKCLVEQVRVAWGEREGGGALPLGSRGKSDDATQQLNTRTPQKAKVPADARAGGANALAYMLVNAPFMPYWNSKDARMNAVALYLLGKGASPNARADGYYAKSISPLMTAALGGNVELARALLTNKADVKAVNSKRSTATDYALNCDFRLSSDAGAVAVVKLLLQAGAKLPAAPQLNGERIDVQGNAGNCPQLAAFGKKVRTASASAATVKESGAGAKKAG